MKLAWLKIAFWSFRILLLLLVLAIALPILVLLLKEPWEVRGVSPLIVTSLSGTTTTLRACKPFTSPRIAYCGVHKVFEDRKSKTGREIPIHFVLSPATDADARAADPVFSIDGGPGIGKATISGFSIGKSKVLESAHDFVFIDIRGTGRSNPLSCVGIKGSPFDLRAYVSGAPLLALDLLSVQHHLNEPYEADAMRKCARRLSKRADLSKYTTTLAAADIDEIRALLGYQKINVSGASYGTRLSLEYARRYPDAVRTLTLVDVVPTSLRMPSTFAHGTQKALDRLFADCAMDAACAAAYPSLANDLSLSVERLDQEPARFRMKNPLLLGLVQENVVLARGPFVMGIRGMLYDYESSARIPYVISRAAAGDYEPMAQEIIGQSLPLELSLAKGLYLSMTCAEDVPFIDLEKARADAKGTVLGGYRLDQHLGACAQWPRGAVPADWLDPVQSNAPALLFSGELDPSTPPETGLEVAQNLPNSLHVVFRNETHGAAANWDNCGAPMEASFVENADIAGIDTSCANKIERAPFYIQPEIN